MRQEDNTRLIVVILLGGILIYAAVRYEKRVMKAAVLPQETEKKE